MKKFFICVLLLCGCMTTSSIGFTANATQIQSCAQGQTVYVVSFWSHGKTTNKATVIETGDGLIVNFKGESYSVRSSDREGYSYMFYAQGKCWYFNY